MPRGSHFLLLRQKQVTKEKATPAIGLFPRIAVKKAERKKLASLKQFSVLIAFLTAILGANQRGPGSIAGDRAQRWGWD